MAVCGNMVKIDPDKLKVEMRKRGLTYAQVGKDCGYSDNLLSNAYATGHIRGNIVKLFELLYHINPDLYVVKGEPKKEKVDVAPAFDWQRLYNVIYDASYNAFKKVLSE